MHFKTIKRDEILPMIEQAKNVKEQKKILCDLIDCSKKELEELIKELFEERGLESKKNETNKVAPKTESKKTWSKDDIKRLRELRSIGKESKEIAEILGRSTQAVKSKCCELKIPKGDANAMPSNNVNKADELADIATYVKVLEKDIEALNEDNKRLHYENSCLKEHCENLKHRIADHERIGDADAAENDSLNEKLEEAWQAAEKSASEAKEMKDLNRRNAERLSRLIYENNKLYEALSKAVQLASAIDEAVRIRR